MGFQKFILSPLNNNRFINFLRNLHNSEHDRIEKRRNKISIQNVDNGDDNFIFMGSVADNENLRPSPPTYRPPRQHIPSIPNILTQINDKNNLNPLHEHHKILLPLLHPKLDLKKIPKTIKEPQTPLTNPQNLINHQQTS